ncbi:MAG: DEAD/DEAH box helicase [Streptococcaceae bacterium]|nr:DEAD/DEAH box helicase [Streptococcaceae bacterium]
MTFLAGQQIVCNHCGSQFDKRTVKLQIEAYYCPACLNMGRVRSDQRLISLPQESFEPCDALVWQGKLTKYQAAISEKLIEAVAQKSQILVHAVTGAGKTEMMYAAVNEVLKVGGSVCIATPRIDVCIELHKRMTRDFTVAIALLHGEGDPYFRTPLVIATTHQLIRFREAFDLLIIDEVDAFPFRDNEMLYFAAKHARKPDSTLIYLTATSTDNLDKQVKSGQLQKVSLARRFHGNPLIVPKLLWQKKFKSELKKQRLTGFPLLIFAPEIDFGQQFAESLQIDFPDEKIGFVASTTENRLELVEQFRAQELTILISTTILERGVTFPKVDVFVYNSGHFNFTNSALVQIAGRVGRSPDRPTGLVYFFHLGRSKAMIRAVREIKEMNKLGGFKP